MINMVIKCGFCYQMLKNKTITSWFLFFSHWVTRVLFPSGHLPSGDGIVWDCSYTRRDPLAIWPLQSASQGHIRRQLTIHHFRGNIILHHGIHLDHLVKICFLKRAAGQCKFYFAVSRVRFADKKLFWSAKNSNIFFQLPFAPSLNTS